MKICDALEIHVGEHETLDDDILTLDSVDMRRERILFSLIKAPTAQKICRDRNGIFLRAVMYKGFAYTPYIFLRFDLRNNEFRVDFEGCPFRMRMIGIG